MHTPCVKLNDDMMMVQCVRDGGAMGMASATATGCCLKVIPLCSLPTNAGDGASSYRTAPTEVQAISDRNYSLEGASTHTDPTRKEKAREELEHVCDP